MADSELPALPGDEKGSDRRGRAAQTSAPSRKAKSGSDAPPAGRQKPAIAAPTVTVRRHFAFPVATPGEPSEEPDVVVIQDPVPEWHRGTGSRPSLFVGRFALFTLLRGYLELSLSVQANSLLPLVSLEATISLTKSKTSNRVVMTRRPPRPWSGTGSSGAPELEAAWS